MSFAYRASACTAALAAVIATPAWAGELRGVVYDATDTIALQSAQVTIVELDRVAASDRDGGFIFADVPAGTYTVEARYVGAEPQRETITVPETGAVSLDFALGGFSASEILVVGQAFNQASALSRKREADGVSDVLTRDAIGEFPDQNVAESLRRLPGVNILDDQGEGRFVSVRGLDPELNATSVNGVRMPAPESDTRAVALDVISSDTIESIEVKKSLTPDMDADTIGASIEIHTTSAFDRKRNLFTVSAEGSYNDYSGEVTPKGSFDFSARLGDDFGVSGGASYYERKFETDNVESDAWEEVNGTVFSPTVEYRDYDPTRKRLNFNLGFDWRASSTTTAYVKGIWSQFDDHEFRRRTTFDVSKFDKIGPSAGSSTGATFDDADARIQIERDLKDRFERQRIRSVVVGSDTDTGTWKFDWLASYAKSSELETHSIDPIRFTSKFSGDGVVLNWDYSDPRVPVYSLSGGADLVNDPSNYEFDRIELTTLSNSVDREWAAKADLARTFSGASGDFTVQAGAKGRWRKKSYDFNMTRYDEGDTPFTMAGLVGDQTYRLKDISLGPVMYKQAGEDFLVANANALEIDPYKSALDSATDDYWVKEDITAGYLLGRWDSSTVRAIAGVRVEHTSNVLHGNLVTDDEDTYALPPVSTVEYDRSYTDWLPSATLRYSPGANVVARLAAYKSLVRPKLSAMAPRYSVNEDNEAEFGNPELMPYRAWNFDAGLEYYLSGNGALSVAAFYKDIKDYAVTQTFSDYTYEGHLYDEFRTTINGDSAEIYGLEASFSQAYTMLPAPFDGLLTQVNYTHTHSKGTLADGREIPLPDTSRNTFNVVLGFEKGPIDLRLAGTYRDKYLDEIGDAAEEDRWVDNHFQLDFSGKIKVTDNLRLTVDVININDAKYFAYQNFGGAQRLLQYEQYGPTIKFGAKANF